MGVAQSCHPNESVNGDAWAELQSGDEHRFAVIDGAGHGPEAALAAIRARDTFLSNPDLEFKAVLARCHVALKGTRGAVMTVAAIRRPSLLTVAGVGNVETYLWSAEGEQHLVTQRGMLGATLPRVRAVDIALEGHWALVLHSDGVRSRFSLRDEILRDAMEGGAQPLARSILEHYSRATDDATVVVVLPS